MGQLQGHREGPRGVEQGVGLKHIRQGAGQGIEEGGAAELLQLAAAGRRRAPDQLKLLSAEGQHREGAFGAEQLPGLVGGAAAQLAPGR